MAYRTADGITILEGLEVVRHRPSMYIGPDEPDHSLRSRLLELVVDGAAQGSPPPREVRMILWREGALTIAFDGVPFPIEPSGPPDAPFRHPALERLFLHLFIETDPSRRALSFGAVLNALCERCTIAASECGPIPGWNAAFDRVFSATGPRASAAAIPRAKSRHELRHLEPRGSWATSPLVPVRGLATWKQR